MNQPAPDLLNIGTQDYMVFRKFLEEACGIVLGENKQYLVSSRLNKILSHHRISGLIELVQRMSQPGNTGLREAVIDAMTTNETLWFRDIYPFDVLKNIILPEFQKKYPGQRFRLWSAACSSGQEPYSLSMAIEEFKQSNPMSLSAGAQIVSTDISPTMLESAKKGEYEALAMGRGLSPERLKKFFDEKEKNHWVIKPPIRARVDFQAINLMDNYGLLGKFDVIFCRNVLIYFSADLKIDILRRMHKVLRPGGYIFLGASEALNGLSDCYQMIQCNPGILYKAVNQPVNAFDK
jgi:chemotaxis protein methyltransferase CheR